MSWVRHARYRMGTIWEMAIWASRRDGALRTLDDAFEEVARLERLMSRFLPESQLSSLARAAGQAAVPIDPDLYAVLAQAQELSGSTDGAFDVTMGPLVALWDRAALSGVLPTTAQIHEARALVDYRALRLVPEGPTAMLAHPGMSLDLGAIGKGFAVDRAVDWLLACGYTRGWVNAGGNVRFLGSWDHAVPVCDPRLPDRALRRLVVTGGALSTSANYERSRSIAGQRYGHLLDPRTGWPVSACLSVTVHAPTAALADALSTACFILGPARSQSVCAAFSDVNVLWCVRVDEGMQIVTTPGFSERLRSFDPMETEDLNADVSVA